MSRLQTWCVRVDFAIGTHCSGFPSREKAPEEQRGDPGFTFRMSLESLRRYFAFILSSRTSLAIAWRDEFFQDCFRGNCKRDAFRSRFLTSAGCRTLARQHHTVEDTSPHEYPPIEEPGIDPLIMKLLRRVTQIRAIPPSRHRQNILS